MEKMDDPNIFASITNAARVGGGSDVIKKPRVAAKSWVDPR